LRYHHFRINIATTWAESINFFGSWRNRTNIDTPNLTGDDGYDRHESKMVWKGIIRLVPSTWNDLKENSPCERFLLTLNIDYKKEETIQAPPHLLEKIWKNDETIPLRAYGPLQEGKNIT
jgi:hypothetical protein